MQLLDAGTKPWQWAGGDCTLQILDFIGGFALAIVRPRREGHCVGGWHRLEWSMRMHGGERAL